jgi:hypothetical protein
MLLSSIGDHYSYHGGSEAGSDGAWSDLDVDHDENLLVCVRRLDDIVAD